ncbi:SusD family protein [compost metagenome]
MRKIMIFCLVLSTMVLGSCKKFLAEYSQDEMRPGSTDDLAALMYSDAYPYLSSMDNIDLLTDDVQSNGLAVQNNVPVASYVTAMANGTPVFTYDPTMFDGNNPIPSGVNLYEIYYAKIKGCNVILDQLANVQGTEQAKNAILGQCLFLRAFYHFKLVSLYALPYRGAGVNPETTLGIPLILSSQVRDGGLSRPSLKQTYDQVEKDLLQSADLLKANYTPTSVFRVGAAAAYACLSRFYLYRGLDSDVDQVIAYANKALELRNTLTSLSTFVIGNNVNTGKGIFDIGNTEVLWTFGGVETNYFPALTTNTTPPFTASSSLLSLYDKGTGNTNYGDLRYQMYFSKYVNNGQFPYTSGKVNTTPNTSGAKGFRVSEVYLNRAEALILRFIKNGDAADGTQALADLNYIRSNRYDTRNTAYVPISITDGQALFTFYQQERRRELNLEDRHRWQDIRRWSIPVTHVFIGADGVTTTYTLPANSPLYALPIPYTALNNNPDLIQNPR